MASIHEYILWVTWNLLTLTAASIKNPVHDMLFPTQDIIGTLLSTIVFANDLMDALQSKQPPTLAFFKTLPTDTKGLWGVYLIVLEKIGQRPKIYIGCSFNIAGMNTRFSSYNNGHAIPHWVQQALYDKYTITYKGVLCWTPIPDPSNRFPTRALLLLLETVFSVVFWAMCSRTKSYGMPVLPSWELDTFEYDGCCGHVAISEGVRGEEDGLTARQIAIKEAEMDKRYKQQMRLGGQKYYQKVKAGEFPGWYERKRATNKKSHAKVKKSKKWYCKPCDKAFYSQYWLNDHKTRSIHLNKVNNHQYARPDKQRKIEEAKAAKTFYCSICDSARASASDLKRHKKGPRHLKRAAAIAEASS
jgi:hypothetical protein